MKGHMQDGKFHPHTNYKKVSRKKREPFRVTKDGVKITERELIQMQRADVGRRRRDEPDGGWEGMALSIPQLANMYGNCGSEFSHDGKASFNAIKNYYKGSATHVHARSSCEEYHDYCYYCGLNLGALEQRSIRKERDEEPEPVLETELSDILEDVTVDETQEGEIDWKKLDKVVRENIQEILEREKVWKKGFSVDIQEVGNARNDTPDEGGFYQFDYQLFDDRNKIEKSGTVYGDISAGDVIDMNLELYNQRAW